MGGQGRRRKKRNALTWTVRQRSTRLINQQHHGCSPAQQRRQEMHPKFESDHLYGAEHFLLFSRKLLTIIAFLVCTLTVAFRVMNTPTYSERILMSQRAFQCSWSYLKWIHPTTRSCTMHFLLATLAASHYVSAQ